jgi:hypothetical protein
LILIALWGPMRHFGVDFTGNKIDNTGIQSLIGKKRKKGEAVRPYSLEVCLFRSLPAVL